MANRIGARLAAWVRLKDADLRKDLFALGEPNDPPTLRARAAAVREGARMPRRPQDPDHPQLRPDLARGLPGGGGHRARLPADRGPRRAGAGADARSPTLLADAEAGGNEQLIRDVQCLSRRLGERRRGRISAGAARRRRRRWTALGPAGTIEAKRSRADGPARGFGRGLSRAPLRRRPLRLRSPARGRRRQPRLGRADRPRTCRSHRATGWR